ncbi:MAG: hypothetical protein R3E68_19400 [Burkholderiaceae bacterium]
MREPAHREILDRRWPPMERDGQLPRPNRKEVLLWPAMDFHRRARVIGHRDGMPMRRTGGPDLFLPRQLDKVMHGDHNVLA